MKSNFILLTTREIAGWLMLENIHEYSWEKNIIKFWNAHLNQKVCFNTSGELRKKNNKKTMLTCVIIWDHPYKTFHTVTGENECSGKVRIKVLKCQHVMITEGLVLFPIALGNLCIHVTQLPIEMISWWHTARNCPFYFSSLHVHTDRYWLDFGLVYLRLC